MQITGCFSSNEVPLFTLIGTTDFGVAAHAQSQYLYIYLYYIVGVSRVTTSTGALSHHGRNIVVSRLHAIYYLLGCPSLVFVVSFISTASFTVFRGSLQVNLQKDTTIYGHS